MIETILMFAIPFAIAFAVAICMSACSAEIRQAMKDDWNRK